MKGLEADEFFMGEALAEARRGLGRTHPNPAVGAVIVKGGKILSRGFHAKAGSGHAEAVALANLGGKAKGATIYSTLEPCNHYGRTPPCAKAIIESGIARVVYASSDPNPLVNGKGHRTLVKAGVKVVAHVLRDEADVLNRPFFKSIRTGLPWVTLKSAISLDGKIASRAGDSKWITSDAARAVVHRVRDVVDAIVVGVGTIVADNPQLTTRLVSGEGHDPVRVVIDPHLRTSPRAKVYGVGSSILVTLAPPEKAAAFTRRGVEVWSMRALKGGRLSMTAVMKRLVKAGYLHVLVEGGAGVSSSVLGERLVDELVLFMAPKLLGHEGLTWSGALGVNSVSKSLKFELLHVEQIDSDLMITARPLV